ncbi:MAG: histidine kinase [Butyrivibrio sp.]|nr:histidine kinase [Butyrivibrio sp.]
MSAQFQKHSSSRLQRRIIIFTLVITLSVGILFSIMFTALYRNYLSESLAASTAVNMKFLTDSIDSNLESVNHLIRWAQENTTISEYVQAPDNRDYGIIALQAHTRLTEEYQNNPVSSMLHRIVICNKNQRFIQIVAAQYSSTHNLSIEIPALPYFDDLYNNSAGKLSVGFIKDPFFSSMEQKVIPIIQPIYSRYGSDKAGWIFIEVTEDLFTAPLEYYSYAADSDLYLVLDDNTYALTKDTITPSDFTYEIEEEITNTTTDSLSQNNFHTYSIWEYPADKKSVIVVRPLSQKNCYIIQTISNQEIRKQNQMLILIWVIVLVIMLFAELILAFYLHSFIAIPVQKIQNQINLVSGGNFEPDNSIEWNHELGDIGRGINKLAYDMEQLIATRIANEKEKQDLEYKVLQNQINPHFLYNTLNSIKWMASVQGADGIADMTTSLSRLMRSISKGTQLLIPISEELALVNDYFKIQNYRYGGTIDFNIECQDEALLQVQIIKFTLQPLVENAIFHGLEPRGNMGFIRIIIKEALRNDKNDVEIIVWDNGVGITPEKIEKLLTDNTAAPSEFFREIGVANVHKRLQYEFGPQYGIRIESELNQYTKMHLFIPKNIAPNADKMEVSNV